MKILSVLFGFIAGCVFTFWALTPHRPVKAASAETEAQREPEIQVSDVRVSLLEEILNETTYSWIATLKNTSAVAVHLTAILSFLDESGFTLDESMKVGVRLMPSETKQISMRGIIKTRLYSRAKNMSVRIETH